MARYITELNIDSYKGITNLEIKNLADINILVGGNNSGKTSVLETLQIMSEPTNLDNIAAVSRQRERYKMFVSRYGQSHFDSFLNMFNKINNRYSVSMDAIVYNERLKFNMQGKLDKILLSADEIKKTSIYLGKNEIYDEEIPSFIGNIIVDYSLLNNMLIKGPIKIDISYNKFNKMRNFKNVESIFDVKFMSTIDHIIQDSIGDVIRNKDITIEVVKLLQNLFDENIVDLRIIENEEGRPCQVIDHNTLGFMPVSTYGDGIRKIIAFAGAVSRLKRGVLLIDEFETSIHPDAMEITFKFLSNICQEKNIQLFLTTHSIEAVEKMLNCNEEYLDNIRIVTLKKKENSTKARVLDAKTALKLKDEMGMELR